MMVVSFQFNYFFTLFSLEISSNSIETLISLPKGYGGRGGGGYGGSYNDGGKFFNHYFRLSS